MPINFHIKTKDMDLTPDLNSQIHEKLGGIDKFINPQSDEEVLAEVEVGLRSKRHKNGDVYRAEINLTHQGKVYRAVSRANDILAALDDIKDQISKQLRRSKDKNENMIRRGARQIKRMLTRK